MKRTELKRGGPLKRTGTLKRTAELARKTRMRQVSKRREKELVVLSAAQHVVRKRSGGLCEARLIPHDCNGWAQHYHHVLPRSAGGPHSPENLLAVCWNSHRLLHDNPREARRLGYLRSRFSRRV